MEIIIRVKHAELLEFLVEGLERKGFRVSHDEATRIVDRLLVGGIIEIAAELLPAAAAGAPAAPPLVRKGAPAAVEGTPDSSEPTTPAEPPRVNLYGPEEEGTFDEQANLRPVEITVDDELAEVLRVSQELEAAHLAQLRDKSIAAQAAPQRPRGKS